MAKERTVLFSILAAIVLVIFVQSCALLSEIYDQNCVDLASSAGHTYERIYDGKKAFVAVGKSGSKGHAQAYFVDNGKKIWLAIIFYTNHWKGIRSGLVIDAPRELDTIAFSLSLREFDERY